MDSEDTPHDTTPDEETPEEQDEGRAVDEPSEEPEQDDDDLHAGVPGTLRVEKGDPMWRSVFAAVGVIGALLWFHAVWATANGVLLGVANPERAISIFGWEVLQGSLALFLAFVGLVGYIVFRYVPEHEVLIVQPGSPEAAALAVRARERAEKNERIMWVGLAVLLVGVLISVYTLRWTAMNGTLYNVVLGGVRYQSFHFAGYALTAIGLGGYLPTALRMQLMKDLARVAERAGER